MVHPVLFNMNKGFISNDIEIDCDKRVMVLTGPNMGGKSTLLRTLSVCMILA